MIKNSQQDEVIAEGSIVPLHYEYVHCGDRINNKGHNVSLEGFIISSNEIYIYTSSYIYEKTVSVGISYFTSLWQ